MKTTKLELARENAELRKQLGDAQHDIEVLRDELRAAQGHAPIPKFLRASRLPAHMQAAKELAVRIGRAVKVETAVDEDFDARR